MKRKIPIDVCVQIKNNRKQIEMEYYIIIRNWFQFVFSDPGYLLNTRTYLTYNSNQLQNKLPIQENLYPGIIKIIFAKQLKISKN